MKNIDLDSANANFWEISKLVKGSIHTIPVKSGVSLSLADYSLKEPVKFRCSTKEENTRVMGLGSVCLDMVIHILNALKNHLILFLEKVFFIPFQQTQSFAKQ